MAIFSVILVELLGKDADVHDDECKENAPGFRIPASEALIKCKDLITEAFVNIGPLQADEEEGSPPWIVD